MPQMRKTKFPWMNYLAIDTTVAVPQSLGPDSASYSALSFMRIAVKLMARVTEPFPPARAGQGQGCDPS
jgi:hypothetical protein